MALLPPSSLTEQAYALPGSGRRAAGKYSAELAGSLLTPAQPTSESVCRTAA